MSSDWFNLHVHSHFSTLDGMNKVADLVSRAEQHGQPGMGLTDHGNMSGTYQLYKDCRAAGITPFPGEEFYLVTDHLDPAAPRYHLGLVALTYEGYQALARLSSLSHTRPRFFKKPRIDLSDLADMSEAGVTKGIALTTGCYFGLLCQKMVEAIQAGESSQSAIRRGTAIAKMFAQWFPLTFVEIQHHETAGTNEVDDDDMFRMLTTVAGQASLPVLITNDSHYCDMQDKTLHDFMKLVSYHGGRGDDNQSDWTFPGDYYHLAGANFVKSHILDLPRGEIAWDESEDSCRLLLTKSKLKIPALDSYSYHIPQIAEDPDKMIRGMCERALKSGGYGPKYRKQMEHELEVIRQLGFADYFLLMFKIVEYCRDQRILYNARGSANGSLVCFLMGLTRVDPMKWDLLFERFLSLDRTRPPDIDLDVDSQRRGEVIEWISKQYEIVPIGTYGKVSARDEEGAGGGSVFVLWLTYMRNKLGPVEFFQKYGKLKGLYDLDKIAPAEADRLRDFGDSDVFRSYGTHAAGFVLSTSEQPIDGLLPTMLVASSNTTVTQMTMGDVEDAGYVKFDLLGLRSLTTLERCLILLGRDPFDWMDWAPLNDSKVFALLRQGRMNTGIFQFEGFTASLGCKEIKPKSIHDLVLINAMYRPATPKTLRSQYRRNRLDPKRIDYGHDIIEQFLKPTYGISIYQEQVLQIMQALGMSIESVNGLLKIVKKGSIKSFAAMAKEFGKYYDEFRDLATAANMDSATQERIWTMLEGFSTYGFNKSHATAYALLGYYLAYLKVNFPLEFHAALLETIVAANDPKKELLYVQETRRMGIRLLPADVKLSGPFWTLDKQRGAIRKGLVSVMGVGRKAAQAIAEAQFSTIDELIDNTDARHVTGGIKYRKEGEMNGVLLSLKQAGALQSLGIAP